MEGRRNPFVAREGVPFLVLAAIGFVLALRFLDIAVAVASALLFFVLVLLFRDPRRNIPASPLGVVSPVDGQVVEVDLVDKGVLHGEAPPNPPHQDTHTPTGMHPHPPRTSTRTTYKQHT